MLAQFLQYSILGLRRLFLEDLVGLWKGQNRGMQKQKKYWVRDGDRCHLVVNKNINEMNIKQAYYYFFYKLYRFWNKASNPFLSNNFRAEVTIIALEVWLLLSIGIYYVVATKTVVELTLFNPIVIIPFLVIILINYYAFINTNAWKGYALEFDQLSKKKNMIGDWIVFGIVLFIIANLVFSFYLMSQIDWNQYK